jgi:cell wall hydrolase
MTEQVNTPQSVDTMARTLWGEARGCGAAGMRHVASVIQNRASHPSWWGNGVISVCLQPWQFSCRNPGDPNRDKLLAVTTRDPDFAVAMEIAQQAVAGQLPDETNGADSYYALSMSTPPAWAAKSVRTFADGWHAFYRTTLNAPPGTRPDARNVSVRSADDLNAAELSTLTQPEPNP